MFWLEYNKLVKATVATEVEVGSRMMMEVVVRVQSASGVPNADHQGFRLDLI